MKRILFKAMYYIIKTAITVSHGTFFFPLSRFKYTKIQLKRRMLPKLWVQGFTQKPLCCLSCPWAVQQLETLRKPDKFSALHTWLPFQPAWISKLRETVWSLSQTTVQLMLSESKLGNKTQILLSLAAAITSHCCMVARDREMRLPTSVPVGHPQWLWEMCSVNTRLWGSNRIHDHGRIHRPKHTEEPFPWYSRIVSYKKS